MKFHSPYGPAFDVGEQWKAYDGSGRIVEVVSLVRYGTEKWDCYVVYKGIIDGIIYEKGAWDFQVRYYPIADEYV